MSGDKDTAGQAPADKDLATTPAAPEASGTTASPPVFGPKPAKPALAGAETPSDQDKTAAGPTTGAGSKARPKAKPAVPSQTDVAADSRSIPPEPASPPDTKPVASTTAEAAAPRSPSTAAPRRGGVVLPLLGGVLAAGVGFGVAQLVPQGWPLLNNVNQIGQSVGTLEQTVATLQQRLADQDRQILALSERPAADPGLTQAVADLDARLADMASRAQPQVDLAPLQQELNDLRAQIAALPTGDGVTEELARLRAATESERAEAEARAERLRAEAQAEREATEARAAAIRAEAEQTARTATARGAVLRLQAALDAGGDFAPALADLTAAGVEIPATLTDNAAGVPTLVQLQSGFAEAARAALAADHATVPADAAITDRLSAFFKAQTGMRALTPQAGDGTDALLSRAEAALMSGDLTATLAELDRLPPEAAAAMTVWRAGADARQAAATALAGMATGLTR